MIAAWRKQPQRFGAIAFGLLGLAYGLFVANPWSTEGFFLVDTVVSKIAWACIIACLTSILGYRNGTVFIRNAALGYFARAAGTAAFALVRAMVVGVVFYCFALICTGDFGVSLGVFGSFPAPYTLSQKLMATVVVFFVGFWRFLFGAALVGFLGGYPLAVIFAPVQREDEDITQA